VILPFGNDIRLWRVADFFNITLALPRYNCLQSKQYHLFDLIFSLEVLFLVGLYSLAFSPRFAFPLPTLFFSLLVFQYRVTPLKYCTQKNDPIWSRFSGLYFKGDYGVSKFKSTYPVDYAFIIPPVCDMGVKAK